MYFYYANIINKCEFDYLINIECVNLVCLLIGTHLRLASNEMCLSTPAICFEVYLYTLHLLTEDSIKTELGFRFGLNRFIG